MGDTKDLIIDRESPFSQSSPDYFMTVAQIMISCSLCIGTPLNYVPVRMVIFDQFLKNAEYTLFRGLLSSFIFASTTCIITIYVPEINVVLGVVGGIGCVAIGYIIPTLAYITSYPQNLAKGIIYIIIACILIGLGFGSAVNSIYKIIE